MSERDNKEDREMRDEYDFSHGVRGKYAERFKSGSNVVVLDPDIAAEFSSPEAVNNALRVYLKRRTEGEGGVR